MDLLEIAVDVMDCIVNDRPEVWPVNVPNNGAIAGLPDDLVIEAHGDSVDRHGAQPLASGPIPEQVRGLVMMLAEYQHMAADVAWTGTRAEAIQALAANPLVAQLPLAETLFHRNGGSAARSAACPAAGLRRADVDHVIHDDAAGVAEAGAQEVRRLLAEDPGLAVAIATGNSPIALYARLAELRRGGAKVDADRMTAVQLDSYVGTPDGDERSLWDWMRRAFVEPMGLRDDQVLRFLADAPDPAAECARVDAEIADTGGLGLAVLGLGPNGHLGFNEPPSVPGRADARRVAHTREA